MRMNILFQAYMCAPDKGGEFAVSWGWLSRLNSKLGAGDKIYVVSDALKREHLKNYPLEHVELLEVKYPKKLYNILKRTRIWFILWQKYAYRAASKTGIKFDVVHVYSLSDFRRVGEWYKMKDAYTILGPVGGGQKCPDALLEYDEVSHKYRDIVNLYCKYSLFYKEKVKRYSKTFACNYETQAYMPGAEVLPDVPLNERLKNLHIIKENHEKPILLYCGRLINKKGLMLLLDVVEKISKNLDFELQIYGEGPQKEALINRILELNLQTKVSLKGFVSYEKMSIVYSKADVFVMPSLRESGGSVLIEAMAHKLPIVALDMSLSRILAEHRTGLFVNVNNTKDAIVKEFVFDLEQLIVDERLRTELGQNGYKYVNTELTWDKIEKKIYGDLVDNK